MQEVVVALVLALAWGISRPGTIVAAGGVYMAIRRNDPVLLVTLMKHVFRSKEPAAPLDKAIALLPKGKADE